MVSFNRVLLIGNLTKDPELRYIPSGTAVASLRLAVNTSFKGQDGQRKEETCYITVVTWGKQAEVCNQYLKKGRSVFVEGRLVYRSWEAEGKTRSTIEVRADRVQFLGGGPRSEEGESERGRYGQQREPAPAGEQQPDEAGVEAERSDADVPF